MAVARLGEKYIPIYIKSYVYLYLYMYMDRYIDIWVPIYANICNIYTLEPAMSCHPCDTGKVAF